MKKTILFTLIGISLLLAGCIQQLPSQNQNLNQPTDTKPTINQNVNQPMEPYSTLAEYAASIDYSCNTDSDCEIKDIHNCCGYYPECVNKNAKVDPNFVVEACTEGKNMGSSCGFPAIDSCICANNKCQGRSQE